MGPAPKAAAARRAAEVGGLGPTNQARPPEKRRSAAPGGRDRKATLTGAGREEKRPTPQTVRAAPASAAALRRRGQAPSAANASA